MGDLSSAYENGETHNISAVIFDLDGTLLSTEQVTKGILKEFLAKYGKLPDNEKEDKRLGMTQKESAIAIVDDYQLPLTPDEYTQEIRPMYNGMWLKARALPGADRLLKHLHKQGVPLALASNSLRKNIDAKISCQEGWKECFAVILGSDQVESGKPAPDIFLEAAKQLGVDAAHCLVIEDSVIGVKAGKAAGMKVVAVPSLQCKTDQYSIADSMLHSLLELKPELWGLPPFGDWVDNTLLIRPVSLRGQYSSGLLHEFADDELAAQPDQMFGIFFGWAKPHAYKFLKIVLSIGWEHDCCSSKRKMQACIVDASNEQFQECEMELLLVGYVRVSYNKGSLDYIEILDEDKLIAGAAMNLPEFSLATNRSFFSESALKDHCS